MNIDYLVNNYKFVKTVYKTVAPTNYYLRIMDKRKEQLDLLINNNIKEFNKILYEV